MFTIGESRTISTQMTHKHNNWLQILAQEDFPPKLRWSENADFKFSVNNEGEGSAKFQLCTTARSIIIFIRTALPYLFFVFVFF